MIDYYSREGVFDQIVPVSALNGDGVAELRDLIFQTLPEGPLYYPTDQFSDHPERFLVGEIIREKLILATREELPHATAISIDKFDEGSPIHIYASILVERDSQKAIVIGKGGLLLKEVGIAARQDIETFLNTRVHLELHVKVRKKWRDDEQILGSLGL